METSIDHILKHNRQADDAALIDLCSFLSRPSQFLSQDAITQQLAKYELQHDDTSPSPDNWLDRFIFQCFVMHIDARSTLDEMTLAGTTPGDIRARRIALASTSEINRIATLSAAAQLRPSLTSFVLKQTLARQIEIIGEDGWELVTGGAQFLYRDIDKFGSPEQVYTHIFVETADVADARRTFIAHGRSLLKSAIASVNTFWADVFSFRFAGPIASLLRDEVMSPEIAGSLFKLWDRQCLDIPNI